MPFRFGYNYEDGTVLISHLVLTGPQICQVKVRMGFNFD